MKDIAITSPSREICICKGFTRRIPQRMRIFLLELHWLLQSSDKETHILFKKKSVLLLTCLKTTQYDRSQISKLAREVTPSTYLKGYGCGFVFRRELNNDPPKLPKKS